MAGRVFEIMGVAADLTDWCGFKKRCGQGRDAIFIPVRYDVVHPFDFLDGFRFCLSIAAGNDDHGIRVFADCLAGSLPGLHGGLVGDRAGVDDAEIRLVVFNWQGSI